MKTTLIWPRSIDWKILAVFAAAASGFVIPAAMDDVQVRLVDSVLSIALVSIWAGFRIVRPVWYRRSWAVAEFVLVPMVWTSFLLGMAIWFHHIHVESADSLQIASTIIL